MTKIFLVRHGETEWNALGRLQGVSDVKLSSEGIRQAQLLAAHFPCQNIDAVYSSDLARAAATAEILAEKFNLPVIKVSGLREVNFGDWEGNFISDLVKKNIDDFGEFFTRPDKLTPPHGETFLQAQARVTSALKKIVADCADKNTLVVSHGAAIRLTICAALEIPIQKIWAISQSNLSLNILRIDDGSVTVELVNGTSHLRRNV